MSFRLHHERIASATPEKWIHVLHGVFGSGANWRLFMRALAADLPRWGFVLVDQRGHAGSAFGAPPPHDVAAMAEDLLRLEREQGLDVRAVVGHSLGGKIALAYAAQRPDALDQVWLLDSQPGARDEGEGSPTGQVLKLLESLPATFGDRKAFTGAVEAAGQPRPLAAWLAMNLRRDGDDYRLQLDLGAVRSILEDYFRRDMWPEIARLDARRRLHVVVAGRSFVWRDGDRERLAAISAQNDAVFVHDLPEAGHWVNVDAPDALRAMLLAALR
jgi:pimeloyl-ACP methyl ester carboxylesterase